MSGIPEFTTKIAEQDLTNDATDSCVSNKLTAVYDHRQWARRSKVKRVKQNTTGFTAARFLDRTWYKQLFSFGTKLDLSLLVARGIGMNMRQRKIILLQKQLNFKLTINTDSQSLLWRQWSEKLKQWWQLCANSQNQPQIPRLSCVVKPPTRESHLIWLSHSFRIVRLMSKREGEGRQTKIRSCSPFYQPQFTLIGLKFIRKKFTGHIVASLPE